MLKIASYDIVFQDVPGEVSLALNLSQCPNRCPGCHSPMLQEDIGYELTDELLMDLLGKYGQDITCVCFMGGDRDPKEVMRLATIVKEHGLKTAWYSGKDLIPEGIDVTIMNYIKLGPYIESLGGLKFPHTNQRMYKIVNNEFVDITNEFWKK